MKENEGQRRMRVGRRREKIRLQGIREEIRRKKKKIILDVKSRSLGRPRRKRESRGGQGWAIGVSC